MKKRQLTNVLALIYAGADINATNNEGNTALHIASLAGQVTAKAPDEISNRICGVRNEFSKSWSDNNTKMRSGLAANV